MSHSHTHTPALAACVEQLMQDERRLQAICLGRGSVVPPATENPADNSEDCVLCMEPLSSSSVAACSNCLQRCHEKCLQKAVALDSRCPFCREELSTVGYLVGGCVQRPLLRRAFQGTDADLREYLSLPQRLHAAVLAHVEYMERAYNRIEDILQEQANHNVIGQDVLNEVKAMQDRFLRGSAEQNRLTIRFVELTNRLPRDEVDELRQLRSDLFASIQPSVDRIKMLSERMLEITSAEAKNVQCNSGGSLAGAKAKTEPKPKAKAKDRISSRVLRKPASAISKRLYTRPTASIRKRPAAASSSSSASGSRQHA